MMTEVTPKNDIKPDVDPVAKKQVFDMRPFRFYDYFNLKALPLWFVHVACIWAFFIPFKWSYVALAVGLYYFRMFFVTGVYHRYFAHRTYNTSRLFQFILAFFAMTAVQKGVLWWGAHHREHHKHSDQPSDSHTPKRGWLWSHMGWTLAYDYHETMFDKIKDFTKFPELMWLNKNYWFPIFVYIGVLLAAGGVPAVVWGFFVSTTLLWHGTWTINSLSHLWGTRRYETTDTSRNNFVLSLITLGEGWHNNHHKYPGAARNGFFWYEIDITYYVLKLLSYCGLIWNLHKVPAEAYKR